jgi:O-antigen/teichoic acid export membrane protein
VQLGLTAVLFVLPIRVDPQLVVLAWGAGALTSAGIGCLAADLTPIVSGARRWLREDRRRVISFLGDFVMMSGSSYLAIYLVAVFASVRTVAAVRGSAFLFAPLDALFLGIRIFALPALAKAAPSGATGMRRIARVIAVASGVVTALAAVLLAWLPGDVGRVILGATWAVAQPLILVTGIGAAARYVALPAQAGLRALNDTQRIVRLRLKVSGLVLVAAVLGTLAGGAAGAVLGLTLAFTVDALISWRAFGASCREKFAGG